MPTQGKLYLIPTPLGENAVLPPHPSTVEILHRLTYVVAEKAKTARHFIKATQPPKSLSEYHIVELNEHTPAQDVPALLQPALEGNDLGLLSEAGCPGVADPGAALVGLAHAQGIEVVPLVGPSSLLLALMASGMSGQHFCFHGYLSAKAPDLAKDLKRLEQLAGKFNQTQLFIEAPYRNRQVVEIALQVLAPGTLFCIAADLTLPSQFVLTRTVAGWQQNPPPDFHKRPAVFLIYTAER